MPTMKAKLLVAVVRSVLFVLCVLCVPSVVFASTAYVATTGDDSTAAVGDSEHPYLTIQGAIDALGTGGGLVSIADGTYKISSQISITNAVTVKGASEDAAKVTIDGQDKCRCVYINHADAKLHFVTITKGYYNSSDAVGGCVRIGSVGGVVEDCVLSNGGYSGKWGFSGGGIYMSSGRASRLTIRSSVAAGGGGGAAAALAGYAILEDSFITANSCVKLGAVTLSGHATMINCTIAGNTGTTKAGIIVNSDTASVVNCAIFNNTCSGDTTGFGGVHCSTRAARYFNCAWDAEVTGAGAGCQYVVNPLFKNAESGNYRLGLMSALVDAGADRANYGCVSTTDIDGLPRVVGTAPDIGCYENQQDEMEASVIVTSLSPIMPASVSLEALVGGASGAITYEWAMTNTSVGGAVETHSSGASKTYDWAPSAAGVYLVSVTATSGGKPAVAEDVSVQIAVKDIYVAPSNSGKDFPYNTPATATTSLRDAVAAAVDGCTVHVLPGSGGSTSYYINPQLEISKAITLVGEGDKPSDILIDSNSRALYVNNAGAFVHNLSFRGWTSASGRTVMIDTQGGTISNCVICCLNNSVSDWNCGGALYANNAFITLCEFIGSAYAHADYSGNASVAVLNGSRLENSLIHDVVSGVGFKSGTEKFAAVRLSNSSAVNCTIVNCTSTYTNFCALAFDGTSAITNCVIAGTTSSQGIIPNCGTGSAVNCAWDGAELLSESSIQISSAAFEDFAAGDYRPAQGGALFNAGAAVDGYDAITDLAGKPRVYKTLDIGCYEYNPRPGLRISIR